MLPDIKVTLARKDTHLRQILELQGRNHHSTVDDTTARDQGFVSATHDLPLLKRMNASAASVIALRDRKVVGYALSMTREFANDVSELVALFKFQDELAYHGERLGDVDYLVMGQICVDASARGMRLADRMYKYMQGCYHLRFRCCVTAIDVRNTRSRRVHERVGFRELGQLDRPGQSSWVIVVWDWAKAETI